MVFNNETRYSQEKRVWSVQLDKAGFESCLYHFLLNDFEIIPFWTFFFSRKWPTTNQVRDGEWRREQKKGGEEMKERREMHGMWLFDKL